MSNPHSKTPGGQAASAKFEKQQAQTHGTGAPNAPGKSETTAPGNAPVASDSGATNVGIDNSASNVPGEKGLKDVPISSTEPSQANANMK